MAPTVLQETLMILWHESLLMESASQQQVSSKARVNQLPWSAHGICRTVTPHAGHLTLKASART